MKRWNQYHHLYNWLCEHTKPNIIIIFPRIVYSALTSPVISILLYPKYLPFKEWLRNLASKGLALNNSNRFLNEILILLSSIEYCLSNDLVVFNNHHRLSKWINTSSRVLNGPLNSPAEISRSASPISFSILSVVGSLAVKWTLPVFASS